MSGDEVLYVGDHIYGDILRSKKDSAWRTAMIIQELETEVAAYEACEDDIARTVELEDQRDRLEDELRFLQARFKELTKHNGHSASNGNGSVVASHAELTEPGIEVERVRVKRALERVRGLMRQVDAEQTALERRVDLRFHPYWGSLLKEGNEESSFGAQVEEYACLYTSRVSNLLYYSPQQHFRSPRDVMAHELGG